MNNTWNYKEDLQDPEAFEKIEKQYDIKIPEKLKDFVAEHNGASRASVCSTRRAGNICLVQYCLLTAEKLAKQLYIRRWMPFRTSR